MISGLVAALGVTGIFYLFSFSSTYISIEIIVYLCASGATVSIPLFGTQILLTEAIPLMGTGLGEGTVLGDAILQHLETHENKSILKGHNKWIFPLARFGSFAVQSGIYFVALNQYFFAQKNTNTLGNEGLSNYEETVTTESVFAVPPSPIEGAFTGLLATGWAFGTSYVLPTVFLFAIASVRKKRKEYKEWQRSQETKNQPILNPLENMEEKEIEKPDIEALINTILKEIAVVRERELLQNQIEKLAEELKRLQQELDENVVNNSANISKKTRLELIENSQDIPDIVFEKAGITRQDFERMLKGHSNEKINTETPNTPRSWFKKLTGS
jgi:hypothetical protein